MFILMLNSKRTGQALRLCVTIGRGRWSRVSASVRPSLTQHEGSRVEAQQKYQIEKLVSVAQN